MKLVSLTTTILVATQLNLAISQEKKPVPIDSVLELSNEVLRNGYFVVDLETSFYDYFDTDSLVPQSGINILCKFKECDFGGEPEKKVDHGYKFPVVIQVDNNTRPGKYFIKISRGGKTDHVRELTILEYLPKNTKGVIHTSRITGNPSIDAIKVIPQISNRGDTLFFPGENWDKRFKSVSLNGKPLGYVSDRTYTMGGEWDAVHQKDLDLFSPFIEIERYNTTVKTRLPIKMEAPKPLILQDRSQSALEGNTSITLKLHVNSLFPRAKVELIHDESFILKENNIRLEGSVDMVKSEVSVDLPVKPNIQLNGKSFDVVVHNEDGNFSPSFKVTIKANQNLIKAQPKDSREYLIKGELVKIRFTRLENAQLLPLDDTLVFKPIGQTEIYMIPDRTDVRDPREEFSSEIRIPSSLGINAPFVVYRKSGGYQWTGLLADPVDKPKFSDKDYEILPGNKEKIELLNTDSKTNEVFKIFAESIPGISLETTSLNDGVTVTVDKDVNTISSFQIALKTKFGDRLIDTKTISIGSWPRPETLLKAPTSIEKNEFGKSIILTTNDGVDPTFLYNMKAQLVKEDGTGILEPQPFNKNGNSYEADLKPVGLKGGEKFYVQVTNNFNEKKIYDGFMKRESPFLVNAGVSAFEIAFKKRDLTYTIPNTERDTTIQVNNARILNGINIGGYWLPNTSRNSTSDSKRIFGVGLNLIGQEEQEVINKRLVDKIRPRVAISTIWYETVVLGFSYGKNGLSFFMGANINFIDFAKLVDSGG